MNQEVKDEALEQLRKDVLMGFDSKEEIHEGITDMFYDEEDFDEEWLRQEIDSAFDAHAARSRQWLHPTDVDRLISTFDRLIAQRIVCLHKAGYTKQDGEGDCAEVVQALE